MRVLAALMVALMLVGGTSREALAGPAMAAESDAPEARPLDSSKLPKKPPFIDQNVVFLTCASGASLGALITGLPPVMGWIPYSGWPTQVSSLALRMAFGCYYGLMAGVAASGTYSLTRMAGEAWDGLFH